MTSKILYRIDDQSDFLSNSIIYYNGLVYQISSIRSYSWFLKLLKSEGIRSSNSNYIEYGLYLNKYYYDDNINEYENFKRIMKIFYDLNMDNHDKSKDRSL